MLDLGTLRLGIKVDGDEAKSQLNDVGNAVQDDETKTTSLMGAAKNMIKAFAAAHAVKELVKLGKAALDAYADFEQLEGGINKIFGDEAAAKVMKNAERAYQTSGMSMNAYMQNVTGFSAALLNSLEGDANEAARVADMAMQDISDNANTFGRYTAEELAGVYQALARGQYQTLDNLNLGFSGTKEGMQALIDKANELEKEQGRAGDLQIDKYADIIQAIHDVQEEMNITGTTANEAATTISGSVNMMKASWENLLIAIGSGDGLNEAINNFLASLGTVAQNIIPRVIQIAGGIVQGLVQAIPQIMESLATAISNFADNISTQSAGNWLKAGVKLLTALLNGILRAAPQLLAAVGKLALQLLRSFANIDLRGAGRAIINSLLSGLKAAWGALVSWVESKVNWIRSKFSSAKSAGNAPSGRGHRIGLREVPYDGYEAILHKGETILTAAETNRYKEMLNAGGTTYNGGNLTVNVYGSEGMSVTQLADAVEKKIIESQKRRTLAWQ